MMAKSTTTSNTNTAPSKTEADMKNIHADLQLLKENISKLSKHVGENGNARFEEMKKRANENITHLQDYGRGQVASFEKEVKAKPLQSIGVAFAAGLITSYLFGRR